MYSHSGNSQNEVAVDWHILITVWLPDFYLGFPLLMYSLISYLAFISSEMQQVLENLTELPSSTGAEEIDLIFLKGIMENPIVKSLAKVY